jgi:hypothetical protein
LVVVEINGVVDISDSIDEVWSLCELNRVLSIGVSEDISAVVDIDDDEYKESCSFVVVKVLVKYSVDSVLVVDKTGV